MAEQADAAALDNDMDHARRESGNSGFSGTTAKTSFSQEEIADMDAQVMIDVLPDLLTSTDKLIDLLLPADSKVHHFVWKELRTQGSRHSKLYNNRLATFNVHKGNFGSQEYVQPSVVMRALLGVHSMADVGDGPWRPDPLFYRANLAQMLRPTLTVSANTLEITIDGYNSFELLETHFKSCVVGLEFDQEAALMLLELQTQLAIMRLVMFKDSPQFDPVEVINDSFFKRDADGELYYKDMDALQIDGVTDDDLVEWTNSISGLADGLKAPFEAGTSVDAALPDIRSTHNWNDFIEQVVAYFQHRSAQLQQDIDAAGGVDSIMENLWKEVESRTDARTAVAKRQSIGTTGNTPKKAFSKGAISALKAREQRLSATGAESQNLSAPVNNETSVPQLDEAIADEPAPLRADDVPAQAMNQQRAVSAVQLSGFQNLQMQNAKRGKARFIDPQPNAQRISFEDSQPSQQGGPATFRSPRRSPAVRPQSGSSRKAAGKRPRTDFEDEPEDFEPTQDEGFEVDQRDVAAANARRKNAPASSAPLRRLAPSGSNSTVAYEVPASATPSPSKRRRKNPGSTIPPPLPPATAEDDNIPHEQYFERAKVLAKHGRIVATQNRPTQVRAPWSKDEENALVTLIENYGADGISYAILKKQDQQDEDNLARRSAEDMRFKARNMKVTFLQAQVPLPDNWEYVVLQRRQIDQLNQRGIEYQQDAIRAGRLDA
ncbi:hypothetical protein LTR86_002388 [Recurvomyces mirabilis]|nr:hypothetical protein LTR86_002388 [Recurvomyces mirabilis]